MHENNVKKLKKVTSYILLILSIILTIIAIIKDERKFILKGLTYIAFTFSLVSLNKLPYKPDNKVIETILWISFSGLLLFEFF